MWVWRAPRLALAKRDESVVPSRNKCKGRPLKGNTEKVSSGFLQERQGSYKFKDNIPYSQRDSWKLLCFPAYVSVFVET